MAECPKCEGFGTTCLECGLGADDCECGEEAQPWKCEECGGEGQVKPTQSDLFDVCTYPDCEADCHGRILAEKAA